MDSADDKKFMQMAIDMATENVDNEGGPFGAVIVKDGKVIGKGVNRVTASSDPTAHAEVSAIRDACAKLGTFDLKGAVIYTSCEPCPMCLGAIYWARLDKIFYGGTKQDAAEIGFDDSLIYTQFMKPIGQRLIEQINISRNEAAAPFKRWAEKTDKTEY